ncbi:MAG: hypothetical protein MUF17_09075 [Syntrophales bacterium]|jgi:hypothetical protein|nr:hypothetical protein [Syntrophales bacterium]
MRPIDILIETTEILCAAIRAQDEDRAIEAVTILLMQIVEFFGFVEGTFEVVFPFLEQLKGKIEAGDYVGAEGDALALLTKFRALRQPAGKRRKPSARLDS